MRRSLYHGLHIFLDGTSVRNGDSRFHPSRVGRDSGLSRPRERSVHRLPGAATLHRCLRAPLYALGKPEGFVERQVRGWAERWNRAKTEELPEMDRIVRWLHDCLPPSVDTTLVHNDFKLDNVMLRPLGEQVEAVLDWEMTTIGDPLADLGLTMCYWTWASVAAEDDPHPATPGLSSQPGWYTRDQFLGRYAERTGRDLSHIGYHEVLGNLQAGRDSAADLLSFSSRADAGSALSHFRSARARVDPAGGVAH